MIVTMILTGIIYFFGSLSEATFDISCWSYDDRMNIFGFGGTAASVVAFLCGMVYCINETEEYDKRNRN